MFYDFNYVFYYCVKGTQNEDTEPYEKVKQAMEHTFTMMKYNDVKKEAVRKL